MNSGMSYLGPKRWPLIVFELAPFGIFSHTINIGHYAINDDLSSKFDKTDKQ